MRLQDIMSKDVQTVAPGVSADAAWELLWRGRIHHLVVRDGAQVVGIVSDRDLGGARGQRLRSGRTVADVMTPSVVVAAPKTTVRQAANLMRGRSIGSLPVIDRGRLVGIVTIADLLAQLGRGAERTQWVLADRGPRRVADRRALH